MLKKAYEERENEEGNIDIRDDVKPILSKLMCHYKDTDTFQNMIS